jgi:hypothetical protein
MTGRGRDLDVALPILDVFRTFKSVFRDRISRSLGYEPSRVLSRLFCSIIYVLLVA